MNHLWEMTVWSFILGTYQTPIARSWIWLGPRMALPLKSQPQIFHRLSDLSLPVFTLLLSLSFSSTPHWDYQCPEPSWAVLSGFFPCFLPAPPPRPLVIMVTTLSELPSLGLYHVAASKQQTHHTRKKTRLPLSSFILALQPPWAFSPLLSPVF